MRDTYCNTADTNNATKKGNKHTERVLYLVFLFPLLVALFVSAVLQSVLQCVCCAVECETNNLVNYFGLLYVSLSDQDVAATHKLQHCMQWILK